MFGRTLLLPPEYNLARAHQERAKAEAAPCPRDRHGHLVLAAIFEERAGAWLAHEHEALLILN
jgi:hypothetical protein